MTEHIDIDARSVEELGKRLGNLARDGIHELLASKMTPQQTQLLESSIESAASKVEYAFKLAFEFEIRRNTMSVAGIARTDDSDTKSADGKSQGNASPPSPRSVTAADSLEAEARNKLLQQQLMQQQNNQVQLLQQTLMQQQQAQEQDLMMFQKENALDDMLSNATFRTAAQQQYLLGLSADQVPAGLIYQERAYSPDSSQCGGSSGPNSGSLPRFSSYTSSGTAPSLASSAGIGFGAAQNANLFDLNGSNFSQPLPNYSLDAGGNFLYNSNIRQDQMQELQQQSDGMLSLSQLLHASRGQQWHNSEPLMQIGVQQQQRLLERPTGNSWNNVNLSSVPLTQLLPPRFACLPTLVQMRLVQLTQPNSVITLNDFDDKVVGKMATLVESYGIDACLAMLGHLEHRMRTKHVAMRNGPGYLDVAVSRHLDMLKAQRMCPSSNSMQEYAQLALGSPLFDHLRAAVETNRWLKWEHLDQNIIQHIRKLPRDVAVEQLQELAGFSFHNADSMKGDYMKGCIMSVINGKARVMPKPMLGVGVGVGPLMGGGV